MWTRVQGAKGGSGNGFANYPLYAAGKNATTVRPRLHRHHPRQQRALRRRDRLGLHHRLGCTKGRRAHLRHRRPLLRPIVRRRGGGLGRPCRPVAWCSRCRCHEPPRGKLCWADGSARAAHGWLPRTDPCGHSSAAAGWPTAGSVRVKISFRTKSAGPSKAPGAVSLVPMPQRGGISGDRKHPAGNPAGEEQRPISAHGPAGQTEPGRA